LMLPFHLMPLLCHLAYLPASISAFIDLTHSLVCSTSTASTCLASSPSPACCTASQQRCTLSAACGLAHGRLQWPTLAAAPSISCWQCLDCSTTCITRCVCLCVCVSCKLCYGFAACLAARHAWMLVFPARAHASAVLSPCQLASNLKSC
jgi:hypothetical protein